ncbi:hypothetical protein HMF7854_01300 [Sphingomonas ginkgonis]|uniref:Uncharacterized protein n=1 Tax=Sphingomonas ginkgonis TaxID=2315330 RepID=A0A429V6P7_9SPHN|nr:hypothetical protein [Sphingomonas ginkgonis]RST29612.1 hypothetical protein HMF7854_01300 [Sphingomonas ginkgonis]
MIDDKDSGVVKIHISFPDGKFPPVPAVDVEVPGKMKAKKLKKHGLWFEQVSAHDIHIEIAGGDAVDARFRGANSKEVGKAIYIKAGAREDDCANDPGLADFTVKNFDKRHLHLVTPNREECWAYHLFFETTEGDCDVDPIIKNGGTIPSV